MLQSYTKMAETVTNNNGCLILLVSAAAFAIPAPMEKHHHSCQLFVMGAALECVQLALSSRILKSVRRYSQKRSVTIGRLQLFHNITGQAGATDRGRVTYLLAPPSLGR